MQHLLQQLGNIDIYLLDQLMKGRIAKNSRILDAGCGYGRNCALLIQHKYEVFGIDQNEEAISQLQELLPLWNADYSPTNFQIGQLEKLPYKATFFDFIICSAVLHFANDRDHFVQMFEELIRVLNTNGVLWFRMTTKHTIEEKATKIREDIYDLPDGSTRYLLDRTLLAELMKKHGLIFLDPFKTVNVSDIRTMATVVLQRSV